MPLKELTSADETTMWSLWAENLIYTLRVRKTVILQVALPVCAFHASTMCLASLHLLQDVQVANLLWHRCGTDVDLRWFRLTVNTSPKETHFAGRLYRVLCPRLVDLQCVFQTSLYLFVHLFLFFNRASLPSSEGHADGAVWLVLISSSVWDKWE